MGKAKYSKRGAEEPVYANRSGKVESQKVNFVEMYGNNRMDMEG